MSLPTTAHTSLCYSHSLAHWLLPKHAKTTPGMGPLYVFPLPITLSQIFTRLALPLPPGLSFSERDELTPVKGSHPLLVPH